MSKEEIILDYFDSYPFSNYAAPSAEVFFTPYYELSNSSWEGGDNSVCVCVFHQSVYLDQIMR